MGIASLVLGIVSIVLGVVPLLPVGGPATLMLAAVGLPLGVVGLCLGLFSRSDALHSRRSLGIHTAGLSVAVVGTLMCIAWVGGLKYAQYKINSAAAQCEKDPGKCPPGMPRHTQRDGQPDAPATPPAPAPGGPVPL